MLSNFAGVEISFFGEDWGMDGVEIALLVLLKSSLVSGLTRLRHTWIVYGSGDVWVLLRQPSGALCSYNKLANVLGL